jgi:hypothetical protein
MAICLFFELSVEGIQKAVTYEQSPGRFGDNLLSYIHAKWISYKYAIPLLYKPFVYSDRLVMHTGEPWYTNALQKTFSRCIILGKNRSVKLTDSSSTLYLVPYFPESKSERNNGVSFTGGAWDYFEVDWDDQGFIAELRKMIVPIQPIKRMVLPAGRITVAIHARKGGIHDTPETLPIFPLKFLPDEFYIAQIKRLYDLLDKRPLYVHIFTDDHAPAVIMRKFQQSLKDLDIMWGCREHGNSETANVIEDFFAMDQFDCLIHSESNFSFIMNKINNYMISIYPDSFHREGESIIYDTTNVQVNSMMTPIN